MTSLIAYRDKLYMSRLLISYMYLYYIQENITPLHFAAGDGHVAIVQLLLQAGADMDAKDTVRK